MPTKGTENWVESEREKNFIEQSYLFERARETGDWKGIVYEGVAKLKLKINVTGKQERGEGNDQCGRIK